MLTPDISVGNALTALSIAVSAGALVSALRKERQSRRRDRADKIRNAAATVVAKLVRFCEITTSYFDDIQPVLTDADAKLVAGEHYSAVRDYVWHGMVGVYAGLSHRILDEEIEMAYVSLYGYDPRIQALYAAAIEKLKLLRSRSHGYALQGTQLAVLSFENSTSDPRSAELGNMLRERCGSVLSWTELSVRQVADAFAAEVTKLIRASDEDIVAKRVSIRDGSILPSPVEPAPEFLAASTRQTDASTSHCLIHHFLVTLGRNDYILPSLVTPRSQHMSNLCRLPRVGICQYGVLAEQKQTDSVGAARVSDDGARTSEKTHRSLSRFLARFMSRERPRRSQFRSEPRGHDKRP